eukprot:8869123-Pyramimonas_sp.AAC.1
MSVRNHCVGTPGGRVADMLCKRRLSGGLIVTSPLVGVGGAVRQPVARRVHQGEVPAVPAVSEAVEAAEGEPPVLQTEGGPVHLVVPELVHRGLLNQQRPGGALRPHRPADLSPPVLRYANVTHT